MATILITTNCLPGMLYTSVELARRLSLAGHRVVYVGLPHAREVVERQGLEFEFVPPSEYLEFIAADSKRGYFDRWRQRETRQRQAIESFHVDPFLETVRRLSPSLLLVDAELPEHVLALQPTGLPVALLNTFVSIWHTPGLPPPNRLAVPGQGGWRGSSLGAELLWTELRLRKFRRNVRRNLERIGCDRLSLLKRLARENQVDFAAFTDDRQWSTPFTFRTLPALSLHGREFEFPHDPPNHVRYLGPLLLKDRADPELDPADQARLAGLFERRKASQGKRKLIYAAFGSFFTSNRGFLKKLAGAVAERPDWDLVLSLGGRLDPAELGALPERVHAFRWLPQLDVLRQADVAVVHGGINTIDESILNAVPMLAYCGYETDMAGNTSRIVYHQIGLSGDPRSDDAPTIQARLDRLLNEPIFSDNIRRMQTAYQAYEHDQVAVRTVESLLPSNAT